MPPGWTPVDSKSIGPFTTHVTFSGRTAAPSRGLRAAIASTRLCFLGSGAAASAFEAARHASWWIGILLRLALRHFLVAPMPWFFDAVRARTDAMVFLCRLAALHVRCGATVAGRSAPILLLNQPAAGVVTLGRGESTGGAAVSSLSERCSST